MALQQLRCLLAVDDGVGEILHALEETKQLGRTLIIFSSDNGYLWGEHGLGEKRAAYDEAIRVPLAVRHPGLAKAGTLIDSLVLNIDVAPSVLEAARVPGPPDVEGRSFLSLLRGEAGSWRKSFLVEHTRTGRRKGIPSWQAVRTEAWKYVRYPGGEQSDELYDLGSDPHEAHNLLNERAARETLNSLRAELDELIQRAGPLPRPIRAVH